MNLEKRIVIECKCYTWTETGNVPSAKMGFANEAAFYLSFLPETYEKYIVMHKSHHPRHQESLAEYYYRMNNHLLGKTKVAEFDPECKELRIVGQTAPICNSNYLKVIRNYLESKGLLYNTSLTAEIKKRRAGKQYTIRDHVRGLIYSFLTNQTKWYRVEPHLTEINELFYDYDPEQILASPPDYFCNGLFAMKCGNMSTKAQMESLADNIRIFQRIEDEYGSIDAFITSEPAEEIVRMLSRKSSKYKMKMFGDFNKNNEPYHNKFFWQNVCKGWDKEYYDQNTRENKDIWSLVFRTTKKYMTDEVNNSQNGLHLLYNGYSWASKKNLNLQLWQARYTNGAGVNSNMHTAQYTEPKAKLNGIKFDCRYMGGDLDEYGDFFPINDECMRWCVRHATGLELTDPRYKYSWKKEIPGTYHVYRYYQDVDPEGGKDLNKEPEPDMPL